MRGNVPASGSHSIQGVSSNFGPLGSTQWQGFCAKPHLLAVWSLLGFLSPQSRQSVVSEAPTRTSFLLSVCHKQTSFGCWLPVGTGPWPRKYPCSGVDISGSRLDPAPVCLTPFVLPPAWLFLESCPYLNILMSHSSWIFWALVLFLKNIAQNVIDFDD